MNHLKRLLGFKTDVEILMLVRSCLNDYQAVYIVDAFNIIDCGFVNYSRASKLCEWMLSQLDGHNSLEDWLAYEHGIFTPTSLQMYEYRLGWIDHLIDYCCWNEE
jgi:ABC-type tungstate transport system permease subunit